MKFQDRLRELDACPDAVEWVGNRGLQRAWDECERADWMLWLCGTMVGKTGWPTRQELVLAACDCAATALKHVPKGEDRPRKAIATARQWAKGKTTLQEVNASAYADHAAAYAAYAALDAHASAYATAYASYAAYAASNAAEAANAHKKMCRLIRKRLKPGRIA